MPDSSNSHQTVVSSEIMSNKESKAESDKKGPDRVHIDLGEVTQHTRRYSLTAADVSGAC